MVASLSSAPAVSAPVATAPVVTGAGKTSPVSPSLLGAFARAMGALVLCTLVVGALWSRAEPQTEAASAHTLAQQSSGARATP